MITRFLFAGPTCLLGASIYLGAAGAAGPQTRPAAAREATSEIAERQALLDRYCITCHNGRLKVVKVDVDQARTVAARYGVMSVPTVVLLQNGDVKDQVIGLISKQALSDRIAKVL